MAIKHVVTMGYIGSGTGLYFVPTLGYSIGDAVAAPSVPGIEYTLLADRLHYKVPADQRLHYKTGDDRMHYEVREP